MSSRRWHEKETILQLRPRSKSQSPKSSYWAALNQRKVTVVYVRKQGGREGADAAVTGLARCGA